VPTSPNSFIFKSNNNKPSFSEINKHNKSQLYSSNLKDKKALHDDISDLNRSINMMINLDEDAGDNNKENSNILSQLDYPNQTSMNKSFKAFNQAMGEEKVDHLALLRKF